MQSFFDTHKYLLEHLVVPVRRELMREIDWSKRLICVKGTRGVGKTTFLLDFAKMQFGYSRDCLYVNLNHLQFSERTIISFADEFRKTGGKTLILDQVHKYPSWAQELKHCYDNFSDIQIVYSGSSVMKQADDTTDISQYVTEYILEGYSFREFLNLKSGQQFSSYSLNELLENHVEIARLVTSKVKPLAYFNDYLHHGFYPFLQEKSNYLENLLKSINLILEVDISYLQQVELKYLPKLRKLLYIIAKQAPFQPNISKISIEVETSRATIMNYLKYLEQARLIHLLSGTSDDSAKKPDSIYLQNPNLIYSVFDGLVKNEKLLKTFLYNQIAYKYEVNSSKNDDFIINDSYPLSLLMKDQTTPTLSPERFYAGEMVDVGQGKIIPIWLFGFLY